MPNAIKRMINDITTTPDHPPPFIALSSLRPKANYIYPYSFYSVQKLKHPEIQPLHLHLSATEAFEFALSLAKKMPDWQIVSFDKQDLRLEAVATTRWLRFKDDVVLQIRTNKNDLSAESCSVHMRSKSRVGRSDFGKNAERIQCFLQKILAKSQDLKKEGP